MDSIEFIYKVQDIDTCTNKIVLSHSSTSSTLCVKLSGVYLDKHIIRNLPQHHCCWIGYYYGRIWKENRENDEKIQITQPSSKLHRYSIISVDRKNEVVYKDANENTYKKNDVSTLASSKKIPGFSQDDAFYIGFLCAISSERKAECYLATKKPILRVVK